MQRKRKNFTTAYLAKLKKIMDVMEDEFTDQVNIFADILIKACEKKRTVFLVGNGGSASTASHFAGDLAKCTIVEGKTRFKAVALTDSIPKMLAWGNDNSYDDIFIEQLKGLLEKDDVVIGISGSGNSANVLKAVEYANASGAVTLGITGFDGGQLLKLANQTIHIPSNNMQRVEDLHMIVVHLISSLLYNERNNNLDDYDESISDRK